MKVILLILVLCGALANARGRPSSTTDYYTLCGDVEMCEDSSVRSSDYYDLCREHRELQDVTSHGFQTFVGKTIPCKTKNNEKWNSNKNDNDNNIKDINNDTNNNPSPAIKTKGGP